MSAKIKLFGFLVGPYNNFRRNRRLTLSARRRARAGIVAATFACVLATGCLPGDRSDSAEQASPVFPVSNTAAKTDLGLFEQASPSPSSPGDDPLSVTTTAAVVPTSAPAPAATEPDLASRPLTTLSAPIALANFFKALAALERGDRQKPVTILHLGDGHIAADRFTADLRTWLQARFGDAGRGFMAPGLFRVAGVQISRTGNWTVASSAAGDPGPYGLTGMRLSGRKGAVLELTLPTASAFDWAEITFATGPQTGRAYVGVDDKGESISTRTPTPNWQRIRINAGGSTLKVRAEGEGPIHLLSSSVRRGEPGVRYVNLGVPQATALTPQRWKQAYVIDELNHVSPDLIILGYGTNEAFDDNLDQKAYAKGLISLIRQLKQAAPQASLMAIGPPDVARLPHFASERSKACRPLSEDERGNYSALMRGQSPRLGRWHPPPNLRTVRNLIKRTANQEGAFFWDWSDMMGGPCSIHAWVHTEPALAAANHRDFTVAGARRSARALFRAIMKGYETYRARTARAEE